MNESITQFLQVPFSVRLSKTKSVQIDGPFSHTHTSSHCCSRLPWVSSCELAVAAYAMVSLPRYSSSSFYCCCSVGVPMLGHKAGLRVVLVTVWADNAFDVVADVVTHTVLQGGERRCELSPLCHSLFVLVFFGACPCQAAAAAAAASAAATFYRVDSQLGFNLIQWAERRVRGWGCCM